jgi:hypothetical protein
MLVGDAFLAAAGPRLLTPAFEFLEDMLHF